MKISVTIPTLNAEKKIIGLLNSLSNQSIKDLEIVIIDSGSVDKTKGIAAK